MKEKRDYTGYGKLSAILLIVGMTLAATTIGCHTDYGMAELVVYCIIGIVLMIFGFIQFGVYKRKKKEQEVDFPSNFEVTNDNAGKLGEELLRFREDVSSFFMTKGIKENSDVQNDTTQVYKNVLDLQKKRLDRLGLQMDFRSIRKQYTDAPIHKAERFDGKYAITDVDEEIEAKRLFTKESKRIFLRTSNQIARYTILDAKRADKEDMIICPNCGNATTRENLIDGCDYCGTKFTIEDLGKKISSFSLRDKYEIAYAKYKATRWDYAFNAILIAFIVIYLLILFMISLLLYDEPASEQRMNPIFWCISMLVCGGCFAGLFDVPFAFFYMAVILPAKNITASFKYNSKRKLEALKKLEEEERAFAEKIRSFDTHFSMEAFISNLQNKISSIIFAENENEINTFSEGNLKNLLPKYKNVFDYDIDSIRFGSYDVENDLQKMAVNVGMTVYIFNGSSVTNRTERLKINLVKDAACKTQEVCAPRIIQCKQCGRSLSFSNGLKCEYCGSKLNLKEYDWVIDSIS